MDKKTKNRAKKSLNLSILKPGKSNRRTSLSPTANFLKKVGQKLLIRQFDDLTFPGIFFKMRHEKQTQTEHTVIGDLQQKL